MAAAAVSYRYRRDDRQAAVDGVDLTVREGEWLTVLGANGSGKTTLAMLLNGLLLPDSGAVTVDGFQGASGGDIVGDSPPGRLYLSKPGKSADRHHRRGGCGLWPGKPRPAQGGNSQPGRRRFGRRRHGGIPATGPPFCFPAAKSKVAIAGALAMDPRYLIMDEATSMLDPVSRGRGFGRRPGLATAAGPCRDTHQPFCRGALLSDRVAVLANGKLALEKPWRCWRNGRFWPAAVLGCRPSSSLGLELQRRGHWKGPLPRTAAEMVAGLCRLK